MAEWKFRSMPKSEKSIDPIQGQFFTTNIVGGISTALIRETVQNSLDAYKHSEFDPEYPVEVCFRLRRASRAAKLEDAKIYFSGLMPHIESKESGLNRSQIPSIDQPVPYLLIEDYNTYGLEGDPLEFEDPPQNDKSKHNYYWFWRNVGRTAKNGQNLGRWGLGKTVYPASSKLNTFFGLTVQESDDTKMLLMGQSVLKVHRINNDSHKYCPYGDYGIFEDQDANFVSPIIDSKEIDSFKNTFELEREDDERNFHGLSLVIPFPLDEIDSNQLVKASVIQYFYPLVTGRLVIIIEDDETKVSTILEADRMEDVINNMSGLKDDNLLKLISLSRFASGISQKEYFKLTTPKIQNRPIWSRPKFINEIQEQEIETLIKKFNKGETIPFMVPVKVHPIDSDPKMCWFKVFLQKDESLELSQSYFVRDGITITGITPFNKKNIRGLVIIDDPMLSKLLGDAENPAHTEWQRDSPNFKDKYIHGAEVISFVTKSLVKLHSWLIPKPKGVDKNALKDFFHVDLDEDPNTEPDIQSSDNKPVPGKINSKEFGIPNISPSNSERRSFKISKINGGISVTSDFRNSNKDQLHVLRLAYMIPKGMPLKRYNPLDFNLNDSGLKVEHENLLINNIGPNSIEFQIQEDTMKLQIRGFDTERDLYVQIK